MATLLLSAAGAAIGSGLGGTVLGLSGAVIGRAIGATIGTSMLLGIWMAGSVILGIFVLLSRGRKTVIEETVVE